MEAVPLFYKNVTTLLRETHSKISPPVVSPLLRSCFIQRTYHQRGSPFHVCLTMKSPMSPTEIAADQPTSHPSQAVRDIWKNADAVCFDVDSTVCMDEGLDALGEFCGAGDAVAAWTTRAMSGSVLFEDALAARLSLFKPTSETLQSFIASNPPKITPGIEELIQKLKLKGKVVYLISGGFRQIIGPVAEILGIPEEQIFANRLLFDENGHYMGFDTKEPTSRSGGKAAAIAHIKKEFHYNKLVMIGDGATDLEARQPGGADIFICFGGVQFRGPIAAKSDWCILDFKDLIESLD